MGRIRTVKPEWLEDELLLRAGLGARVLSVSLLLIADDYGRGRFIEPVLAAQVFPFETDPSRAFHESFMRLSQMGFVGVYEVRGQRYFEIRNWEKHQRVMHPGKPHVPAPLSPVPFVSGNPHETLTLDPDLSEGPTRRNNDPNACADVDDLDPDLEPEIPRRTAAANHQRPPVGEPPPGFDEPYVVPEPEDRGDVCDSKTLEQLFSRMRKAKKGGAFRVQRSDYDRAQKALEWAHEENPEQPILACEMSIAKFLQHARGELDGPKAGWPFWAWANDPGKWLALNPEAVGPEDKATASRRYALESAKSELKTLHKLPPRERDIRESELTQQINRLEALV
jgi:hypothetical protein